jgi:hypothetical protein
MEMPILTFRLMQARKGGKWHPLFDCACALLDGMEKIGDANTPGLTGFGGKIPRRTLEQGEGADRIPPGMVV